MKHRKSLKVLVPHRCPRSSASDVLVDGERVVGYDNERGKGDHRHLRGVEVPYRFMNVETLVADFMADVEAA